MKVVVVSGFFNPLHGGHLDMIEAARKLGDKLVVVVNNDEQQISKKGKIILDENNRMRLMRALKHVDEVVLAIDTEETKEGERPLIKTLTNLAEKYKDDELIFANGGDRDSDKAIPETEICNKFDIKLVFGVGSHEVIKRDSSSRINQETGHEIS